MQNFVSKTELLQDFRVVNLLSDTYYPDKVVNLFF